MADLLVRIDGVDEPVRLADCFWVLATPGGCAAVSLVGTEAATPEAAHIFCRSIGPFAVMVAFSSGCLAMKTSPFSGTAW